MIQTVSFIGSGNVATHLAMALQQVCDIQQIWSRSLDHAKQLAIQVNAQAIDTSTSIIDVDLLLICVPDDAIQSIIDQLTGFKGIIAHTSGASGLDFLPERMACFYPLQSFRKYQDLDLATCPFFIMAKQNQDEERLVKLASKISKRVRIIAPEQKLKLHLAAVFINNYVNHLFGLTEEFLSSNELDLSYLDPIIKTTIERAKREHPFEIQTGPAIRNDQSTLQKHMEQLENYIEMKEVYEFLAKSIQNTHLL